MVICSSARLLPVENKAEWRNMIKMPLTMPIPPPALTALGDGAKNPAVRSQKVMSRKANRVQRAIDDLSDAMKKMNVTTPHAARKIPTALANSASSA